MRLYWVGAAKAGIGSASGRRLGHGILPYDHFRGQSGAGELAQSG
jgi:hypothetical protein